MFINDFLSRERVIYILNMFGAEEIREEGNYLRCKCPIHKGENKTAFVWNLENHTWYCHTKCKEGGDLIRFIARVQDLDDRCDFEQIVNNICAILNIDKNTLDLDKEMQRQREERKNWIKFFNKNEHKNKLYDIMSLGNCVQLKTFRKYSGEIIKGVYLNTILNRLVFEILNEDGEVVGVSCRRIIETDNPKWLHRPKGLDTGLELYNIYNIKEKGYENVYIVEGMVDVMAFRHFGIENVVCTFGANITEEQILLLSKYFTKVTLSYDNDEAGFIATIKAIDKLKDKFEVYIKNIKGEYKDVDEVNSIDVFNTFEDVHYIDYLDLRGIKNEDYKRITKSTKGLGHFDIKQDKKGTKRGSTTYNSGFIHRDWRIL